MKAIRVLFIAVMAFSIFASCSDSGEITEIDGINKNLVNSPAVSNTKNSFSIAVKSEAFNSAIEYPVTFEKADFDIALSIGQLTSGTASIQIFNDTKQMLYNGEFTSSYSLAQHITLDERPTKVKFIFNNLTASFSCALTVK